MHATNVDLRDSSARTPEAVALPAASLGGYRLVKPLGSGGMGTVFLAFDEVGQRRVALKILAPELARLPLHVGRFQREARSAAALNHPNIVRGLGFGQDSETRLYFLVLEYVDGFTAQALLDRKGRLDMGDVVAIGLSIARALEYAHGRGIIHRDIKPENLFLSRAGTTKLGDLGLAKQLDDPASQLTVTRQAFGTTAYMPYEQALNSRFADTRSDIYALGGTLYHLLSGEVPFPGDDHVEIFLKKREGQFLPPRKHVPDVPLLLDRAIARMLAADPRNRFQTAAEVRAALELTGLEPAIPSFAETTDPSIPLPATLAEKQAPTQVDLETTEEPWWLRASPLSW
jgi:serine/threonine-protein kinase